MRKAYLSAVFCMLGLMLLLSCSCKKQDRSESQQSKSIALGDITVDRCFFYTEGENFQEKSGGDLDVKEGASGKKCLGIMWGGAKTDFVTYKFNMEEPSESNILVIRAAIENRASQTYNILIDDKIVQTATMDYTGGWGYTKEQWKSFSIALGPIAKGEHSLTIRPSGDGGIMNIDCLAMGRSK